MIQHNALRALRLSVLSISVALMACMFFALSVNASTASSSHSVASPHAHVTLVNIIKDRSGHYNFNKRQVIIDRGQTLVFCNLTNIPQTIQAQGIDYFTIPVDACIGHMIELSPGTYVSNLKSDQNAIIIVHVVSV